MKELQLLDLRSVSRASDRFLLTINLVNRGTRRREPWILAGQAQLRAPQNLDQGYWRLSVRAKSGVTDFEHDSAYVLAFDLYGVTYLGTECGTSTFHAMLAPEQEEDFKVPLPGYDPELLPGTTLCTHCEKPHAITKYIPPSNPELFRLLAGSRLEITIGGVV